MDHKPHCPYCGEPDLRHLDFPQVSPSDCAHGWKCSLCFRTFSEYRRVGIDCPDLLCHNKGLGQCLSLCGSVYCSDCRKWYHWDQQGILQKGHRPSCARANERQSVLLGDFNLF